MSEPTCEECRGPLGPAKPRTRKNQPRRFCRARCRSAWHHRQRQAALEAIIGQLDGRIVDALRIAREELAVLLTNKRLAQR